MQIQRIDNTYSQSFKAINMRYMTWAKEEFRLHGEVPSEIFRLLRYDVFLYKKIAKQDAIDTVEAIKKLIGKTDELIEHILENFKNPNP